MAVVRLLLCLILLALLAAPARAGTYEHHTGRRRLGAAASPAASFVAADAGPDGLRLRFWARPWFAPGEIADWIYTAPADTTLAGWELERTVTRRRGRGLEHDRSA